LNRDWYDLLAHFVERLAKSQGLETTLVIQKIPDIYHIHLMMMMMMVVVVVVIVIVMVME